MYYKSTRNSDIKVESAVAITQGISEDGGLFVPESFPSVSLDEIKNLASKSYNERAYFVLSKFLSDFTEEELKKCIDSAYTKEKFETESIAPVYKLNDTTYFLELWHGPTCAFKDMALQILPHLLTTSMKKTNEDKEIVILVATSGDTGKAALEGFKDVAGTRIIVFYPDNGVSEIQKLQMVTQEGNNVSVAAVKGNFDDAQSGVKKIFTDTDYKNLLDRNQFKLSSANSINWGRLVPQIVYYFSSYAELVKNNEIEIGDKINVVVPTGNFGNILAGYYAKKMGLPIKTLVCASNSNNVLTDFLKTGTYDKNRKFYTTTSPSMDILISSNLERLLYHMSDGDDKLIVDLMNKLSKDGKYTVSNELIAKIQKEFDAGYTAEENVDDTIKYHFDKYHYLCDTHTAVAVKVYDEYVKATGDDIPTVIDSTASPYKFSASVLNAVLAGKAPELNEFEMVDELHNVTGADVPKPLASLKDKEVRFSDVCNKEDMSQMVFKLLNL